MQRLMGLTGGERIEPIDLEDPAVIQRFPSLTRQRMMREIHAVDDAGRVWRGADAIREALSRQPGILRAISGLWRVPGFQGLADYLYRHVATARRRDETVSGPAARQ